ncbi:TPA: hypothetical protein MAL23_000405 [Klebsiella variicola]|uniref:hypothetical protein n=1 Tax=Klebsiella variicola TaxID=244366 RepID=UPI00115A41D9|nr:hypothetical protein [Klebsiella variicola]HBS5951043.1 hypothetical protein [Klebsiella variicola]
MAELRAGCQTMIINGFYHTNDRKLMLIVGFVPNATRFTLNGKVYLKPVQMADARLVSRDLVARDGSTGEAKKAEFCTDASKIPDANRRR